MTAVSDVQDEINKRLTLNVLIQGAAMHAVVTAHYLVRDELEEIDPDLIPLYDRQAIQLHLSNWYGDLILLTGRPSKFWRRTHRRSHPFHGHALLATHGAMLADASREFAVARAQLKKVRKFGPVLVLQTTTNLLRVMKHEQPHLGPLQELVSRATSRMWGIDEHRLEATLTMKPAFGEVRKQPLRGKMYRAFAVGWSGVVRGDENLQVVARAVTWPLLAHEMVKGVAELVCLHGLNTLDEDTYDSVMQATDRIDFEPWHMQAGSELWRQFLSVLPPDRPLAEVLMHVARLTPRRLEALMMAVIEEPEAARHSIANI